MTERLPPLTALRAFEAAARHMSFREAANELYVTPAALSFQIKSLEQHLGVPVFRRLNRKVELTETGKLLAPGLTEGFETLQSTWQTAQRKMHRRHLTVTAGPAFLAGWLAPKMAAFVTDHPELELRLTASLRFLNFERDNIDLAIRFGSTSDDGYFSERLFQDWATPMVAPQFADHIKTPSNLHTLTFIRQDTHGNLADYEQWDAWCQAAGIPTPEDTGPVFSSPEAALSYAANGGGVVLGRVSLAEPLLSSGRLITPLPHAIRRPLYYRAVCPLGTEDAPNIILFRSWIKREFKTLKPLEKGKVFL